MTRFSVTMKTVRPLAAIAVFLILLCIALAGPANAAPSVPASTPAANATASESTTNVCDGEVPTCAFDMEVNGAFGGPTPETGNGIVTISASSAPTSGQETFGQLEAFSSGSWASQFDDDYGCDNGYTYVDICYGYQWNEPTTVTLTAHPVPIGGYYQGSTPNDDSPATGSEFVRWDGDCAAAGTSPTCVLHLGSQESIAGGTNGFCAGKSAGSYYLCVEADFGATGSSDIFASTSSLTSGNATDYYSTNLNNDVTGGTPPYTFDLYNSTDYPLPPGLTLNPTLGVIDGTPTKPGEYWFEIEIIDGSSPPQEAVLTFELTISEPGTCSTAAAVPTRAASGSPVPGGTITNASCPTRTTVTGKVQYQYSQTGRTSSSTPVRDAVIYLYDENPAATGCLLPATVAKGCAIAKTVTSNVAATAGQYTFSNITQTVGGKPRLLQVVVQSSSGRTSGGMPLYQVVDPTTGNAYSTPLQPGSPVTVASTATTIPTITYAAASTGGQVLSVFDAFRLADDWAAQHYVAAPQVVCDFPAAATQAYPGSSAPWKIDVQQSDAFDLDPIIHEFGHAFEYKFGLYSGLPVTYTHSFGEDIPASASSTGGTLGKEYGEEAAWGEGFADYFPVAVRNEVTAGTLPNRADATGTTYTDVEPSGTNTLALTVTNGSIGPLPATIPGCGGQECGAGDEASVARFLWAMGHPTSGSPIIKTSTMLTTFKGVTDLDGAVGKLAGAAPYTASLSKANTVGTALANNNVGPRIQPVGSVSASHPPTFTWSRGGDHAFPNNQFTVYFFTTAGKLVTTASLSTPGAGSTSSVFTWTPSTSSAVWKAVAATHSNTGTSPTLLMAVQGANSASPADTASYPGPELNIGSVGA